MSDSIAKSRRLVYFWEDHQYSKLKESSVGRKGLSLFELKDMDIPIPDFFVISPSVFQKLVSKSILRDAKKLLDSKRNPDEDEVLKSILKSEFEDEVVEDVLSAYTRISGFTDAWVSVRSSVVFPDIPEISFSGIFSTELNVRGGRNLLDSVKRIYASLFSDDVVAYASSKGINLADVKLAVVVQKMVQAEVSGVAFTIDPITQDTSKLSIEAIFGLGDTISLGELTPDTYVLNKKDLDILEKRISPQEWMKIRILKKGSKRDGTQKVTISGSWSHRQKVEDKYLKEISKIALIVENKLRKPQNIEWVLSGGRVWVLQSKELYERYSPDPVRIGNVSSFDTLGEVLRWFAQKYEGIDVLEEKAFQKAKKMVQSGKSDYNAVTQKLVNVAKVKPKKQSLEREDLIAKGLGASFGIVVGSIQIVEKGMNVQVSKNTILVIKEFSSEMESLIINSGGVILPGGGITSDTAILCREFNIPAVTGVREASLLFRNGQRVQLDGNTGSIYKVKEEKSQEPESHPVVQAYKNEKLSGIDLLKTEVLEEEEAKEEKTNEEEFIIPCDMSLSPCATKVFLDPVSQPEDLIDYVGNSHGLVSINMDKLILANGRHPLAYVEDKKFVEYSKEICFKICKYVELAQGNRVVLAIGSSQASSFRKLVKGKQFENSDVDDSTYGLAHYLENKELLSRVLKIVRRVRNVYKKRNLDIGIYAPMAVSAMKEFKKGLLSEGLRRTASFKIYAILDSPTDIILSEEILETKIDGLILDMPRIVRVMQGFKINDFKAKYNLGVNSSLKIVDVVCETCDSSSNEIIIMAEDNEDLVRHSIQKGVYGISVLPESVKNIRKVVSKEESDLILGK
jgi:pyruvate, water dikinase